MHTRRYIHKKMVKKSKENFLKRKSDDNDLVRHTLELTSKRTTKRKSDDNDIGRHTIQLTSKRTTTSLNRPITSLSTVNKPRLQSPSTPTWHLLYHTRVIISIPLESSSSLVIFLINCRSFAINTNSVTIPSIVCNTVTSGVHRHTLSPICLTFVVSERIINSHTYI